MLGELFNASGYFVPCGLRRHSDEGRGCFSVDSNLLLSNIVGVALPVPV